MEKQKLGGFIILGVLGVAGLYILWKLLKGDDKLDKEREIISNEVLEDICYGDTPTWDGTTDADRTLSDADAFQKAEAVYIAMDRTGTQEQTIFNALECLNGRDLQLVACQFGRRQDKTIFEWFYDEFQTNSFLANFSSQVYHCNTNTGCDCSWEGECDKYWDQCDEMQFLRSMWKKSGITW